MKRIAILKNRFYPQGGLEKHAHQLAKVFADRGHETLVLTQFPKKGPPASFEKAPPYSVISLGSTFSTHLKSRIHFDRRCEEWAKKNPDTLLFGFDRIRCQTHYLAGDGVHKIYLAQRKYADTPLKHLSHRFNPKHKRSLAEEKTLFEEKRVHVFPNSHMVREDILETYDAEPEKLRVVHNGIEWKGLQNAFDEGQEKRSALFKQLGLDPTRYQFLFVGHGYKRKGLLPLLDGLASLPKDLFQLSVVGREAHLSRYLRRIKKLKLENNVKLFGGQKEVSPFFQVADACVIPSLYDPFANVTLEALAMGLYVVTSDHNGGKEALIPESGAVIEALFDPESVADALQQAFLHPKTPPLAKAIRDTVSHYEVEAQLGKIVDLTLN